MLSDLIKGGALGEWRSAGDDEYNILCPNPEHPDTRLGSCFINVSKNVFICYSCGAKGHARLVLRWLGIDAELPTGAQGIPKKKEKSPVHFLDDMVLHAWRYEPTEWLTAGLSEATLQEHEIGYDTFNRRITVPIRDRHSRLIAISGRATEEWQLPRYKFYGAKELLDYAPPGYRAAKGTVLWRHHLLTSPDTVVVVEGFKGAMWLAQHGYPAVATMGKSVSQQQASLLAALRVPVTVFFDGDPAGRKGQIDLGITLYRLGVSVSYASPRDSSYITLGLSPDDLLGDQLAVAINEATPHRPIRRSHESKLEPTGTVLPTSQARKRHGRRRLSLQSRLSSRNKTRG